MREYATRCLRFPFSITWVDPDLEDSVPVEVCCLGLKEGFDRRGLFVKCSVIDSNVTRFIPLEQLHGVAVTEETWNAEDPAIVASRVISDYRFWLGELHGLDPSSIEFDLQGDDGHDDGPGLDMFRGFDGSYFSDDDEEEDGSGGDEMLFGSDVGSEYDDLSSGALAELQGQEDHEMDFGEDGLPLIFGRLSDHRGEEGDGQDDDDDEDDDEDDVDDLGLLDEEGDVFPFDQDDDEKNWKIDYDDNLDLPSGESEDADADALAQPEDAAPSVADPADAPDLVDAAERAPDEEGSHPAPAKRGRF